MANLPALVLGSTQGYQQNIGTGDALLVGTGIDRSTAGSLSLGDTTATSITFSQHAFLGDSKELRFGNVVATPDFKIYSDGTDGIIENTTSAGNLIIKNAIGGARMIQINVPESDHYFEVAQGATSELKIMASNAYWGTTHRRANDTARAYFGTDNDMSLYHSGVHGYLVNSTGDLFLESGVDVEIHAVGVANINNLAADGNVLIGNSGNLVTIGTGAISGGELVVNRPTILNQDELIYTGKKIKWGNTWATATCEVYGQTNLYVNVLDAGSHAYHSVTGTGWVYFTLGNDLTSSRFVIRNSSLVELVSVMGEAAAPAPPGTYAGKLHIGNNAALALGNYSTAEKLAMYTDGTDVWSVKNATGAWYFDNTDAGTATVFRLGNNLVNSTFQFRSDNDTQIFTIYGDATGQFNGHLLFPDNKELRIGTGSDLVIKHDGVDTTVVGAIKFQDNVTLGADSTDNVVFSARVNSAMTFTYAGGGSRDISVQTQAVDTVGTALTFTAGAAGAASAAAGKAGGQARIRSGVGSAGTAVLAAGAGGATYIYGGAAGADNGGGGAIGGNLYLHAGAGTGAANHGDVSIGTDSASTDAVRIGHANVQTQIIGAINHDGTTVGLYGAVPTAQAADMGALTDSTGGAVDGTLVAISGTGDDANINNNYADLAAKVNAIRTALRNIGIMA